MEREADITHAVLAVHMMGGLQRPHQRAVGAHVNRDRRPDKVPRVESVLRGLFDGAITRHRRYAENINIRVLEGHHESDRIVGCGVGVDEELPRAHGRNLGHVIACLVEAVMCHQSSVEACCGLDDACTTSRSKGTAMTSVTTPSVTSPARTPTASISNPSPIEPRMLAPVRMARNRP